MQASERHKALERQINVTHLLNMLEHITAAPIEAEKAHHLGVTLEVTDSPFEEAFIEGVFMNSSSSSESPASENTKLAPSASAYTKKN